MRHGRLLAAMEVAGYVFDKLESCEDYLRFFSDAGTVSFDGWQDLEDWLNGVVFDDPAVQEAVDKALQGDKEVNNLLWDILMAHKGHKVEIAVYGDWDDPADICLEDLDTNEVILDAELYTLASKE